jgi:hydrogenase maturation protein HypF
VTDASRVTVSLLHQLPELSAAEVADWTRGDVARVQLLHQALRSAVTPWTSSLGRLFDGIAGLIAPSDDDSYIGEPAARLEALCDRRATGSYAWKLDISTNPWLLDWRPMLRDLLRDLHRQASPGVIAERFHRGVAAWMLALQRRFPDLPLVVGGGVFQNRRLCELLVDQWPAGATPPGLPGAIPPNDGGLAAGQLAIAQAWKAER